MGRVILCAETESLIHPELLGLEGVSLDNKDWLVPVCDAAEARELVSLNHGIEQVWVVASDQLDGANLAAAISFDSPNLPVYLVGDDCNLTGLKEKLAQLEYVSAKEFIDMFAQRDAQGTSAESMPALETAPVPETAPAIETLPITKTAPATEALEITETAPATEALPDKDKTCFIVSLLSGSGGVGKSTFAALAGCLTQSRGFKTAVIDADSQFGDLSRLIGDAKHIAIDELLGEPGLLMDPAINFEGKTPVVIDAPSKLESSEDVTGKLDKVVRLVGKYFDVVFVDSSTSWGDDQIWLLENSDVCLFFLDQRASSIHSVKHAIDLCMRMGIATGSFVYLLNRCSKNAIFSGLDISNVVQGAQVGELRDGQSEVEEYLGSGLARELAGIKNELPLSVSALLDDLLPSENAFFNTSPKWELPAEKEDIKEKSLKNMLRKRPKRAKTKER